MTPQFEQKICAPQDLAARAAALPKKLVFTNGVFDILHRGHVTYLAQARALGASLVVLLNSDASVKRLGKGDDRPINTQADRMAVMAALGCVDLVCVFDEDTPYHQIIAAHPDILVKGGDWAVDKIVGGAEVAAWGGQVCSIAFEHERSTTAMLKKIRISP
jgi:D-glycero-beta-D-manno-heptose 1-phosphate adenylyltransferase